MVVTDLFESRPEEIQLLQEGSFVVLNTEQTLKLYRKDTLLHSFVCSPSRLGELCAGWLLSEGYAGDSLEVSREGIALVQGGNEVPAEVTNRCSGEQVCATTEEMLALFNRASDQYARSHGIHECVLKGKDWHILRTDIGRHNAIDKAVGAAVLAGYDLTGAVMFTSGRINVQTVKKAVRCGIGCLMSKAVITAEALTLAKHLGLTVRFRVK